MKKATLASDDELLAEHLPYEIWMLQSTHERLNVGATDQIIANALIESFCIHARQLLEFFENKQGKPAMAFTGGSYQSAHLSGLESQRTKLNTQIAHLTERRTSDPSEKVGAADRTKLLNALEREARHFESSLAGPSMGKFTVPVSKTVSIAPGSSATNSITTTSST